MSRDAFLTALADLLDRTELALDRAGGQLAVEARLGVDRDLRAVLSLPEAGDFLGARELPGVEDELRERLRDLLQDEIPELLERLAPAPAPLDDPEALARVLLLREAVLPELDMPLPPPTPPACGKPQPMLSFAPLRAVLAVAVLVGVGLSRFSVPGGPPVPWSELRRYSVADGVAVGSPPAFRLRLPSGKLVLPISAAVEIEQAGALVEGVTTFALPVDASLEGGGLVEARAPEGTRVVGFAWEGQPAVAAEALAAPAFDRRRRSPPGEDPLYSWRRQATLPPWRGEATPRVRVHWRGIVEASFPSLDLPFHGLPDVGAVDLLLRPRQVDGAVPPGWLEQESQGGVPSLIRDRVRLDSETARVVLRLPKLPAADRGLWRWGPRHMLASRHRVPDEPERPATPPRIEWIVDGSIRGAPFADQRLAILRALDHFGRVTVELEMEARILGAEAGAALPLGDLADRLETTSFLGAIPALELAAPGADVRRVLVLQGPGVSAHEIVAAARLGSVLVLGQEVDPTRIPAPGRVTGLPVSGDPKMLAVAAFGDLKLGLAWRGDAHPLEIRSYDGPDSLLGAPVSLEDSRADRAVPVDQPAAPAPSEDEYRTIGACEPGAWTRASSREPELIFGAERRDPDFAGRAQVLRAAPEWTRRSAPVASVSRPPVGTADRLAWEQALLAAADWTRFQDVARAWRRADPRNPWPLLHLAEAATGVGEPTLARRALASVPVLSQDPWVLRVARTLALGAGDRGALRALPARAPDALSAKLDAARAQVVLEGPQAAVAAYRAASEAAYLASLAGKVPLSFAVATRAEARIIEERAKGRQIPGILASLEPAGREDCLALRLMDRAGQEVRAEDGVSRGGGRLTSGIAGVVSWARAVRPGDAVVLGIDPGAPGPDGAVRGVLVMLRPGVPGFDVRLVSARGTSAWAIHREEFSRRKESR